MSGIIGYKGKNNAIPFLISGLKKIEQRGYDSIGLSVLDIDNNLYRNNSTSFKKLLKSVESNNVTANTGIACSCWNHYHADDQLPSLTKVNSNSSFYFNLYGQIQNAKPIIKFLTNKGVALDDINDFYLLSKLIEYFHNQKNLSLEKACCKAISMIEGKVSSIILTRDNSQTVLAINKGGALSIGVEYGNYYIASDISAIKDFTDNITNLKNGDIAIINEVLVTKKITDVLNSS